ncbi:MAG: hypothetical protein VKK63_08505 [Synechococcus sp.]|nr:hypothetical protein [Synechococcus sp.]
MHLIAQDEYGYNYAAKSFSSIEQLHEAISLLDNALEDASIGESHAIQAEIDQLNYFLSIASES